MTNDASAVVRQKVCTQIALDGPAVKSRTGEINQLEAALLKRLAPHLFAEPRGPRGKRSCNGARQEANTYEPPVSEVSMATLQRDKEPWGHTKSTGDEVIEESADPGIGIVNEDRSTTNPIPKGSDRAGRTQHLWSLH